MMAGASGYRVPADNWKPAGWTAAGQKAKKSMITDHHVHLDVAWKTPQFWLVVGRAVPQRDSRYRHHRHGLADVAGSLRRQADRHRSSPSMTSTPAQKGQIAAIAAGFTGLLSLFNIGGRFVWASLSDKIGRKMTYYDLLPARLRAVRVIPTMAPAGSLALFVAFFCIILSMYGGGFATVPAYLADMFGTKMVGAIHGRLLTAWATAGVLGPVLVNYIREYQLDHGVARADAYTITMYILAGLLVLGFICNWLVKSVAEEHYMTRNEQLTEEKKLADDTHQHFGADVSALADEASHTWKVTLAWMAVWIPLGWGIWMTLQKTIVLFK